MSTQKAEALFDFEPTAEVELKMQKGEVVVVKRMSVGEGWWEGELNGKRGLFPSSFVKLLPAFNEPIETSPTPPTPLTPRSTKKEFMETLLAPEPSTLDDIYDEERAIEMFVPGHTEVAIQVMLLLTELPEQLSWQEVGPKWKGRPPTLTVVVKEPQTEPRFSGMRHVTLYEVETKELESCVTRKYKQFLWLYDRLAENFPCVSLPPLPIKQFSGQERKAVRRRGLEKFLRQVARHPVLGCTKFLKVFLSDKDAKPDKEWKIGKHLSHLSHNIKLSKTSRKLFHAPVYCTVKYPPYNVPISQLASVEKFSKFSRLLEANINTLHAACQGLSLSQREMMGNINLLAKDFKCFARGVESTRVAQRRKLQAKLSVIGPPPAPPPATGTVYPTSTSGGELGSVDIQEENSGGEDGEVGTQWNWRDDEKFTSMIGELLDLASGMQRTSLVFQAHQEAMESLVMETLQEYSGVINTHPGLVRLHEEAMEYYNNSKNKDSKKEAEEVRQHCETLNNILLAEFDYFSNHLVEDFEEMIQHFLHQQGEFYRKLADEWNALHTRYKEHLSRRNSDTPIHTFTSPTPSHQPNSASQPHLHTLQPPSTHSQRTPSDALPAGGGYRSTSHSQDNVTSESFRADISMSQSHPNIHSISLGPVPTAKYSSSADSRPTATSSIPPAPPSPVTSEPKTASNYVNVDMDEFLMQSTLGPHRNDDDYNRRLKSLSPLELSIERELEKNREYSPDRSSGDYQHPGTIVAVTSEKLDEPHQYANWQFAQMNEKLRRTTSAHRPLANGGPTEKQTSRKPTISIPRKPLKPPSPFRLQNLSEVTALDDPPSSTSAVPLPSLTKELSPQRSFEAPITSSNEHHTLGKALSTSKLHEIVDKSRTLVETSAHSTRNMDRLLPSQLNLNSKPRSYTSFFKKKPILPPAVGGKRASLKAHSMMPGPIHERSEMLDSFELESSLDQDLSKGTKHSDISSQLTSSLGQESSRGTTVSAKTPSKHSSPSSELMRKLSQRRQKLEQQLVSSSKHASGSTTSSGMGDSSRCTSTSSTQSELVCTYHTKRYQDESPVDSREVLAPNVELRTKEDSNLAKYGIMEDVEGGSYVI